MKPVQPHIKELFGKYLEGNLTKEELSELLGYFGKKKHTEDLIGLIQQQFREEVPAKTSQDRVDRIAQNIEAGIFQHIGTKQKTYRLYKWMGATAAVLLITGTILFFNGDPNKVLTVAERSEEILSGTNRAMLTIDGSKSIPLSEQEGILVTKGDTIGYGTGKPIMVSNTVQWATLTTPRAGQYQVVLDDGTRVWLNAASKIRYPIHFSPEERRIFVSGEVYLEVAHNKDSPFIVETEVQTIRVLGTKFNIEAYNEIQYTTLVEGSVEIISKSTKEKQKLIPNQQARTSRSGTTSIIEVDVSEYTAWTNGLIVLNNLNLREVTRQLERWYDVTFDPISENLGHKKVFGSLKRDLPLKDVLAALESNYDVKFIIRGRRISVTDE